MKIAVVTPRFAISGVPLAQLRFARALSNAGHDVELLIGNADAHLTLPEVSGFKITVLDKPNVRSLIMPLWRYLRREQPDIIFSAEDHLNTIILAVAVLARSRAKISGSSRVTPFDTYSNTPLTKRWVLKQLARLVNRRADALTCVSKDMVTQYATVFPNERRHAVYNIVDDQNSRERLKESVAHRWFGANVPLAVAAGNLAPWKGFADLIAAVALLRDRGIQLHLIILGEGPLHAELKRQVLELSLEDHVELPGYVINPLPYFVQAKVFVLSSHVEGMPNVLVEAMMAGCTPVAADCPTGPRELLQDERYGYLVIPRDPAALADGIERALRAPIDPGIMAEAVRPFEEKTVIARHFAMLGLSGAAAVAI